MVYIGVIVLYIIFGGYWNDLFIELYLLVMVFKVGDMIFYYKKLFFMIIL